MGKREPSVGNILRMRDELLDDLRLCECPPLNRGHCWYCEFRRREWEASGSPRFDWSEDE